MSHTSASLSIYLLGPPRLERNGQPVAVDTRKAIALLAYLALHPEQLSRDQLAAFFWPEYDPERAYANLRRTLWALNKAIGEGWIAADNLSLHLRQQAGLWLDVLEFQRLLAQCRDHSHRSDEVCSACLEPLGQAAQLVRGDFLDGFSLRDSAPFDDWHFFEAESLRKQLAVSLEKLVQGHSSQQEDETAITYARRWLALDPLHEPAHRWLMQLYAWTGQPAAALRQYQECVRILNADLAAPPEPETTALHEQIRTGKLRRRADKVTRLALAGWQGDKVTDLPDTNVTLSPPHLVTLSPVALPAETATRPLFVARSDELATLEGWLKRALAGEGGVVFVTGEAGSGKSTLLGEFAQRAAHQTDDLLVAGGYCNLQSGPGDPYLPFRQLLRLLTGDLGMSWAHGVLQRSHAERLWAAAPATVNTLLENAVDLLDTFIPGTPLRNRMAATGALPSAALQRLEYAIQQQARNANGPAPGQPDLLEQVANFLRTLARRQPLLLIIDDLHWADAASLTLLFHLGRQLTESRVLLVGAYRPEDVAVGRIVGGQWERHPLEAVVNELQRNSGEPPIHLDQAGGREFVNAWLDTQPNRLGVSFRTALHRHTQGQPLFTIELVRALQARGALIRDREGYWVAGSTMDWQAFPARVEAVIGERLARLDEPTRQLLAVASVEGEEFTAEVLMRVQGTAARPLLQTLSRELEKRHRLVRRRSEVKVGAHLLTRYQFSHALFQHYLYHELGAGERRLLHGEIAAALAELYQGRTEDITAQLAHHYGEAGETAKAIEFLLQAGDQARTLYAHQEAIAAYQRALAFLKEQGDYERAARTLMKLGLTYHQAFDFQQAQQTFDEYFTLWQKIEVVATESQFSVNQVLRVDWVDPPSLDPTLIQDTISTEIIYHLFSGLVTLNPDLSVVPAVAHTWEVFEDGRKYIFHLRNDERWSDSAPVSSEDFVYAWRRRLTPAFGASAADQFYAIKNAKAFHQGRLADPNALGVRALDPLTLEIELEEPVSSFLHFLGDCRSYPIPRHRVEEYGAAWTEAGRMVNNGPFCLESWQHGQRMVFVRNPLYFRRMIGNVQRVELHLLAPAASPTRLALYQADSLDVLTFFGFLPEEADRIRLQHAREFVVAPHLNVFYLVFDLSQPPFDDVRVRQAFALTINRDEVANVILRGYHASATGGFLPPGMPGHTAGIGLPYDPARARQLLSEAGYPGGHNFPPINLLTPPGDPLFPTYLMRQWRGNLDVTAVWETLTTNTIDNLRSRAQPYVLLWGESAHIPDPDSLLNDRRAQSEGYNQAYTSLLKQARHVMDQAARLRLYQQADRILIAEAIVVPLYYARSHFLIKPWVKCFPLSPIRGPFWQDVIIEPH